MIEVKQKKSYRVVLDMEFDEFGFTQFIAALGLMSLSVVAEEYDDLYRTAVNNGLESQIDIQEERLLGR